MGLATTIFDLGPALGATGGDVRRIIILREAVDGVKEAFSQ